MLHLSVLCLNNCVGKHFSEQASWHFFFPPPLFIKDGILLHLYIYFICINFISVC